jgi:hypothetical protein
MTEHKDEADGWQTRLVVMIWYELYGCRKFKVGRLSILKIRNAEKV